MLSPIPFMLDPVKYDPQSSLYQTKLEKDQYLASSSAGDQFATDVKGDDEGNNAFTIIEGLFLNIEHKSSYKRFTEKVIYKTCKFFMHSARHMSFKKQVVFYRIGLELRLFQALRISSVLQIEVDTDSKGILGDKMRYGKVKYQIF